MAAESETNQGMREGCEWIVDKLERHASIAAALALTLVFVIALGQSARKFLWNDELVTLKTALLPHWSDTWNFYARGLDTTGPMQSLIARLGLMLPIGPELGSRLPFTLAYLVMCLCIYVFVHRRYPAGYALAALIYPLQRVIFYYATEARAYALVLAGAGIAMICWQSAADGRHRPWSLLGLWLGLAFAVDAHAFAIFLFVPFGLAQLVRDLKQKRMDWPLWTALILFPIGILPVLHGEMLAKKIYGVNFWSQPNFKSFFASYGDFGLGYLLLLLFVAIAGALLQWRSRGRSSELEQGGFAAPEWVLAAMFALLPLYVGPASYLLHVYRSSYVLSCQIGLIVLAIGGVAEAARRNRHVGDVLFLLLLLGSARVHARTFVQGLRALAHPGRVHEQLRARYNDYPWVKILKQSSLPVVTDSDTLYSILDYYVGPQLEQPLSALTDIQDLSRYPETTTTQRSLQSFNKALSYRVADVADFAREHRHFLLIEAGGHIWLPRYLIAQQESGNVSFACVGSNCSGSTASIYDVRFTKLPVRIEDEATPSSMTVH